MLILNNWPHQETGRRPQKASKRDATLTIVPKFLTSANRRARNVGFIQSLYKHENSAAYNGIYVERADNPLTNFLKRLTAYVKSSKSP